MSLDSAVKEAKTAMSESRFADALVAWERALRHSPNSAEFEMFRGLCLVHLARKHEAETSLSRAHLLDPTSAQILSNLAVFRLQTGNKKAAREAAEKARGLDPTDKTATEVLVRLQETNQVASPAEKEPHWTNFGYALIVASLLISVFIFVRPPLTPPTTPGGSLPKSDPLSFAQIILWFASGIACGLWMAVDIIYRKARFAWIVPQTICCFCGVPAAPMVLYFVIGRR